MELLKKLVNIQSYPGEEEEIASFISSFFKNKGYDVIEDNGNVIVHISKNSKKCIIFNAHMDTVEVQNDWETDPFELTKKDGKYYGLGVSDEKVSIAILMEIADKIQNNPKISSDVILAFVVKEEIDGSGSKDFINLFKKTWNFEKSICIICEPRNAEYLGVGCKGNIAFKIKSKGKACHSSEPDKGDNAILKALSLKLDLPEEEDCLGNATIAYPTKIKGGDSINAIPDECIAYGDIRTNTLTHDQIIDDLKNQKNIDIISETLPYIAKSQDLIDLFAKSGIKKLTCTNGTNDAVFFESSNIPSVIFGAGNEECCHISNEYVEIKNIEKTKEVYLKLCEDHSIG